MPPKLALVRPSRSRGQRARLLLESQGLVASVPAMRSSDFSMINECRFLYYLMRRLCLVPAFSLSDALTFGQWSHTCFEAMPGTPARIVAHHELALKARHKELREAGRLLKLAPETAMRAVEEESKKAFKALAWMLASQQFMLPDNKRLATGYIGYLRARQWEHIGTELRLVYRDPQFPGTVSVAQLDKLLLNKKKNLLWIVDLKTHTGSPAARGQTIRIEAQPIHYLNIGHALLEAGILQKQLGLPADVKMGGIIHIIIQKPPIQFGTRDREFYWHNASKRSNLEGWASYVAGQWKLTVKQMDTSETVWTGTADTEEGACAVLQERVGTQTKKEFQGEPSWERYTERCVDWYLGRGDYADERDARVEDPPVNICTTPAAAFFDRDRRHDYMMQLERLYHYATCPADPWRFDRHPAGMTDREAHKLNVYAPFYLMEPAAWRRIALDQRLIQIPRDRDLDAGTIESCVLKE